MEKEIVAKPVAREKLTHKQKRIVERIQDIDAWEEVSSSLIGDPFKGIEIYCYNCGKYMIVEEDTEVKECFYCKGTWIRNDVHVQYKYLK